MAGLLTDLLPDKRAAAFVLSKHADLCAEDASSCASMRHHRSWSNATTLAGPTFSASCVKPTRSVEPHGGAGAAKRPPHAAVGACVRARGARVQRSGRPRADPGDVQMRMGLCLGLAASGLLGLTKPRYCLLGAALEDATALEQRSQPWHVRLDASTSRQVPYLAGVQLIDCLKTPT